MIRYLGVLALATLPLLMLFHLWTAENAIESAYLDTLSLIREPSIDTVMTAAARELVRLTTALPAESDLRSTRTIAARDFPTSVQAVPSDCQPAGNYGNQAIALGCVAVARVAGSNASAAFSASPGVFEVLKTAYRQLQGVEGAHSGTLPSVLFVYATLPEPAGETVAVFPAVHLDQTYDLGSRPWYSRTSASARLELSSVYRDYATNALVVSIVKKVSTSSGMIRVVADLRVVTPDVTPAIFSLNAVVSFAGLIVLWRSYIESRLNFERYLVLGLSSLTATYVLLCVGSLGLGYGSASRDLNWVLASIVSFLPTGTFVATAGWTIRHFGKSPARQSVWLVYFSQFAVAVVGFLIGSPIPSALFGGICLAYLGHCLIRSSPTFGKTESLALAPHPRTLSVSSGVAFIVWGFCQLGVAIITFDSPVARGLSSIGHHFGLSDVLFTSSVLFIVLLCTKAASIGLTVLFVGSLSVVGDERDLQAPGTVPSLDIDLEGRIRGVHRLARIFPPGQHEFCYALAEDPEDRAELEEIVKRNLTVRRYLCATTLFPGQLVAVSIHAAIGGAQFRRFVILRIDGVSHYKRTAARRQLQLAVSTLERTLASTGLSGELPSTTLMAIRRCKQLVETDEDSTTHRALKADTATLAGRLVRIVSELAGLHGLSVAALPSAATSILPVRCRMPEDAFELMVESALAAALALVQQATLPSISVDVGIREPELIDDQRREIDFIIRLAGFPSLRVLAAGAGREVPDDDNLLRAPADWELAVSLARFYGGGFALSREGDAMQVIRLSVPFMLTSIARGDS
jgi:hypothetical protein